MIKGKNISHSLRTKQYNCPYCCDNGYIIEKRIDNVTYGEPNELEYAVPCPHCNGGKDAKTKGFMQLSHIPLAFRDEDLSKFDWGIYVDDKGKKIDIADKKEYLELYVEHFEECEGQGLYFYSKTKGSGKSYISCCLANELMKRYTISAKFVSSSELIKMDKQEDDPVEGLCSCKLLIVDDLGMNQSGASWLNDILFRIFDSRMHSKLPTIITSNVPIDKLSLDERIIDRIYDIAAEIHLPEISVRSKLATQRRIDLYHKWKNEKKNGK